METRPLSDFFDDGGLVITPTAGEELLDLPFAEVVKLFEAHGALIFRDFAIGPDRLTKMTDRFTETYSGDAMRRAERFDQKIIRDVDYGDPTVRLHSEASFAPAWPEMIWLYCNVPPQTGGQTTLCDGAKLWKSLTAETQDLFMGTPIKYELNIPVAKPRPGKGQKKWVSHTVGAGNGVLDWETGMLRLTQQRFAVQESRVPGKLCFANHLFVTLESEDQLLSRTLPSGQAIPDHVIEEIYGKADELTYEVSWQKGDLLMLDNKRFMHGRRPFAKGDPRDLVIVQTAQASFGYGSTTRKGIQRPG